MNNAKYNALDAKIILITDMLYDHSSHVIHTIDDNAIKPERKLEIIRESLEYLTQYVDEMKK